MNASIPLLALSLSLGALSPADRPPSARHAPWWTASPASWSGGGPPPDPAAVPRFATFGWVSPPAESTTDARYDELLGAGMCVVLPARDDSGKKVDNLRRLDLAAGRGLQCLIWDNRLEIFDHGADPDLPAAGAIIDSVVATYRNHPGFLGYYLGDEPFPNEFRLLGKLFRAFRARDPDHPAWNNLIGRGYFATRDDWLAYTRSYLDSTRAAILCNDQYDFMRVGDQHWLVENVAGLRELSRERGLPFWCIILLVEHGLFRTQTTGMIRWQVSQALSYGARGVGYFTYWTPKPDPQYNWQPAILSDDGQRTAYYFFVADFNPRVRAAGLTLAGAEWLATRHAGSVPRGGTPFAPDAWLTAVAGRAAIGEFVDSVGTPLLLVANSDSAVIQIITLELRRPRRVWQLGTQTTSWTELAIPQPTRRVDLVIPAGDFVLLRLDRDCDPSVAGSCGPTLVLGPSPGRGSVRLYASGLSGSARLTILDAGGRRVWSRELSAADASFEWRGEREGGGHVPPGIYFARVDDGRGVAVARVVWLGH